MPKRPVKAQANSTKAASGAFGTGFGSPFASTASPLSYLAEPPDLSSISDPNIVVAFKGLSKKDGTTKSKALEELHSHVKTLNDTVEDGILEAWVQVYPRTSIDNTRRVRQLAHMVHGQICLACGKRIAKHMPQIIGAWLAGLYDNDKAVSRAAQEALHRVFATPEKLHNVRKVYFESTLDFCKNMIDNETPSTLSDERTSSPDELEAKYSRVLAQMISLATNLLGELPEESQKRQGLYAELILDEKLWSFAYYNDLQVRRAVHKLLKVCLANHPDTTYSAVSVIGKAYMYDALKYEQMGTSLDFVECLTALLKYDSHVWTNNIKGDKGIQRLCRFLKRGSQMGPPEYWSSLVLFFENLPSNALADSLQNTSDVLTAIHSGLSKKNEPRNNLRAAWLAYVEIFERLCAQLAEEDATKLLQSDLLPLISQFVRPSSEELSWNLAEDALSLIMSRILEIALLRKLVLEAWSSTTRQLIEDMGTSLPESSKEFNSSQTRLTIEGKRWIFVRGTLWTYALDEESHNLIKQSSLSVTNSALDLLRKRNAKPYGAASIVESILFDEQIPVAGDSDVRAQVASFATTDLPSLFTSPSAPYLAGILFFLYGDAAFAPAWEASLRTILNEPDNTLIERGIGALLGSRHVPKSFDATGSSPAIEAFVTKRTQEALNGTSDWSFLSLLANQRTRVLPASTGDDLLSSLTQSLSLDERAPNALEGLQTLQKNSPGMLQSFAATSDASALLPRLLFLSESSEESTAEMASEVSAFLHLGSGKVNGDRSSQQVLLRTIQRSLSESTEMTVSITTLVRLAQEVLQNAGADDEALQALTPNTEAWREALAPFLEIPPLSSFAITSPLKGAVHLVADAAEHKRALSSLRAPRDADGFSIPLRIAQYTSMLLKNNTIVEALSEEHLAELLTLLVLTADLANDNLGVAGANPLWTQYTPEVESEMSDFVSNSQQLIHNWLEHSPDWMDADTQSSKATFVRRAIHALLDNTDGLSPKSYRNAAAYCSLASELVELHGWHNRNTGTVEKQVQDAQKNKQSFTTCALLYAFRTPLSSSQVASRICNMLTANLTGFDVLKKPEEGLKSLIELNVILENHEGAAENVAKQRNIFFVKHVISWLSSNPGQSIGAETIKALSFFLPVMKDIYGEHWHLTLDAISTLWSSAQELNPADPATHNALPMTYASLRLFDGLRRLTTDEDPNDDLVDAWKDGTEAAAVGLFHLLRCASECPDELNQPLRITNELVARQISRLPTKNLDRIDELYPLLFAPSHSVQQAAFGALHKKIPEMQEQVSLDAALDRKDAKLPEELISLVLEAPTVNDLDGTFWERGVPLPLKGYLLSWLLIFDHFDNASFKVKIDYVNSLRDLAPLPALLEFVFDFLGHSRGKPVDGSKLDIANYDASVSSGDAPQREVQNLLAHLYYLSLKFTSSLTKAWWLELRSRALVSNVEQWTQKYISPQLISTALSSVSQWSTEQSDPSNPNAAGDGETLKVNISPRAKEIRASYDIDDATMSMSIRLPDPWPLRQAEVQGISRVAVDEKKWQSWLRGCQGVITFSNNSIVDGLVAFRRNVVGALKGQTECSICYSLVSADKQLPNKRCSTCKNLFHSGCLFKWFKTSNNSSCPLCRNPFNYG